MNGITDFTLDDLKCSDSKEMAASTNKETDYMKFMEVIADLTIDDCKCSEIMKEMATKSNEETDYLKFMKVIADLTLDDWKCSDSDIVAFIGATKAGKSTLINCLLRNPLQIKFNEATEENILVNDDSLGIENCPKIGDRAESGTYKPAPYSALPGTAWPMWDFPGFGDNKGTKAEIANAINIQTILKQAQSVRFVFLVPFDKIASADPTALYEGLYELYTISRSIQNHVCLVATKGTKGKLQLLLEKKVEVEMKNLSDEKKEIVDGAKEILKHVLRNKSYFHFKSPVGEHDSKFVMADAPDLVKIITRTRGLKLLGKTGIPLSNTSKLYLTNYHHEFSAAVYALSKKYEDLINEYCKNEIKTAQKLPVEFKKSHLTECIVEFTDIFNLSDITEMINRLDEITSESLDLKTSAFIRIFKVLDTVVINAGEENKVARSLDSFQNTIKQCLCKSIIVFSEVGGICNEEIKKMEIELHNLKAEGAKLDEEEETRLGAKVWKLICENKEKIFNALIIILSIPCGAFLPRTVAEAIFSGFLLIKTMRK